MIESIGNKLFLEPYKGERKIEASVKSGFATVKQRGNLVGLKLLADAEVEVSPGVVKTINKDTIVYFEERTLSSEAWSKHTYNVEGIDIEFVVADYSRAIAVGGK